MPLFPGTRFGPYEITGAIGAGGMGEVFRARDTKLNRDVAIKVLPAAFADDPERLARFTREAQTLASLNHPNIATIYGIEDVLVVSGSGSGSGSGSRALVMELVEGEDLSAHIARGPFPVGEALPIARQIAEALEAAHEQGIVHRDLKPANIKVRTDGTVKVLDFGLAKAMDPAGVSSNPNISHSPTLTHQGTSAGMIIGTAAYMSPEQAKGKSVDRRTDIWAFGVVLYEMLTGKRAFKGEDVSETLAAVLMTTPPMDALPTSTPPRLKRLIERCLDRDQKSRLRDVGEARIEMARLEAGANDRSATAESDSRLLATGQHEQRAWMLAAVATFAAIGLAVPALRHLREGTPVVPTETRTDITTPEGGDPLSFAISPDGRQIVFAAAGAGPPRLWLRSLDSTTARPLPGTEGAVHPFWSRDGRSVGFFGGGHLQRLDLAGGASQVMAMVASTRGGTWNADGVVLFAPSTGGPLGRVAATGGAVTSATRLDGDNSHRWPVFLPDGRHFVFFVQSGPDRSGIWLGALDSTTRSRLTPSDTAGVYLKAGGNGAGPDDGWLAWIRGRNLVAQRLDLASSALTGEVVVLADGVALDGTMFGSAVSASATGLLAYRAGEASRRQLVWHDRKGKVLGTAGGPDENALWVPSLAPDGRRIVVSRTVQGNTDLWLHDGPRMSRFTFDPGLDRIAVWSPDGARVVFDSDRSGGRNLYVKDTMSAGHETLLLASAVAKVANDWSRDGRFLLYHTFDTQTGADLWVRPMVGDVEPWVFLKTPFEERMGRFSPDGRLVAYVSNESGRPEIYLRPFVAPAFRGAPKGPSDLSASGQWQVSTAGGSYPCWRSDSKELYYVGPDGSLMAAPVTVSRTTVTPGTPTALFKTRIYGGGTENLQGRQYDVARDGRFLINTLLDDTTATPITLVQNWQPGNRK